MAAACAVCAGNVGSDLSHPAARFLRDRRSGDFSEIIAYILGVRPMRMVQFWSIAPVGLMLLLAAPASAKEEGWLSTSVLQMIEGRAPDKLDALAPATIRLASAHLKSFSPISGERLLALVTDCSIDFAQDFTVVRGGGYTVHPSTAAMIRFSCAKGGGLPDKPCEDPGFKLFARPGKSAHYEIDLEPSSSWSITRCGHPRLYAPTHAVP
jgi:hypothetical protein